MSITLELVPFDKIKEDITVEVKICSDGALTLFEWSLYGEDAKEVILPKKEDVSSRKDNLWQHTCFEVFQKHENGYDEVNVTTSHHWNTYAFESYRSKPLKKSKLEVQNIQTNTTETTISYELDLKDESLLGLCCVLETKKDTYYFALKHSIEKPDFHDPISFCFVLKK
tara:strand:- start:28071 stop:28577 length:507 start_codon:yes stop_codon:yes gene_type:complete